MNKRLVFPTLFFVLLVMPFVFSVDFGEEISQEDQETFDEILVPVMGIYNFIKYGATALAGVMLLFAGVNYMTSGSDIKKRENAKHMATYVVIGLVVIWATPLVVNFLVG